MNTVVGAASAAKTASSPPEQPSEHREAVPIPIIAAGLTICGGLLIAYLVNRWNRTRERESRFASAAVKFRDAFSMELTAAEADTRNEINYMDFLRTAYERHTQAVVAFEPFIIEDKRRRFAEDWNRYRYGQNEDGTTQQPDPDDMDHAALYFLEYSTEWDLRHPGRPRDNTIKRIRQLLSYASAA